MPRRNTFVRSLHDAGVAAWFGGSLAGAVGINGAAAAAKDPAERLRLASVGWGKWAPLQYAAIIAHGIGGLGLIGANKTRLAGQKESRTNTAVKTVVTILAGATTIGSAIAGGVQAKHSDHPTGGVTEPTGSEPDQLEAAQRVQQVLQWATPVLTLVLIVLGAQQGEQQRPVKGLFETTLRTIRN